jgi:hypothetical protein
VSELTPTNSWTVEEGITDPSRFLPLLPSAFPDATLLCVEGGSIAPDVMAVYKAHRSRESNPSRRNTLFPPSHRIACTFSGELLGSLVQLAEAHANPELLDHMAVFAGTRCLLEWHDAFANAFMVDGAVPEAAVAALATPFGVAYAR